ncbi:hypothetical protein SRHO_G00034350 [Serrasalmus rhombeus]
MKTPPTVVFIHSFFFVSRVPSLTTMASEEKASDLPLEYQMDNKQRGLALIFNQEHFDLKLNLNQRRGTAKDKASLTERFQELGFKVKAYDDIKKKKMLCILRKATEANHTDADCFVCVFLSHGDDGHVFARDNTVDIKEITALFKGNRCRSLVGKPKIFIFQPKTLTEGSVAAVCSSSASAKAFIRSIDKITENNAAVDLPSHYFFNPIYHFDDETFLRGRDLITSGVSIVKASVKEQSYEAARAKLGEVLHTLQPSTASHGFVMPLKMSKHFKEPQQTAVASDDSLRMLATNDQAPTNMGDGSPETIRD